MRYFRVISATLVACGSVSTTFAEELKIPANVCDPGVIVYEGQLLSFEDVFIDGGMVGDYDSKVTVYGYVESVQFEGPVYAKLGTAKDCDAKRDYTFVDSPTSIDLVLHPAEFDGRDWQKTMLKVADGWNSKALVKFTGHFALFSNTLTPYFAADSVTVIDTFE